MKEEQRGRQHLAPAHFSFSSTSFALGAAADGDPRRWPTAEFTCQQAQCNIQHVQRRLVGGAAPPNVNRARVCETHSIYRGSI